MGFGLSQENFMETYQRPQIVNKGMTGRQEAGLRDHLSFGAVRISWMSAKDLWQIAEVGVAFLRNPKTHCPCPI